MDFKTKLKELRGSAHLTQDELASNINISRSVIAKYENGYAIPTKENIDLIAKYFKIDPEELYVLVNHIDKKDVTRKNVSLFVTIFSMTLAVFFILLLFPSMFRLVETVSEGDRTFIHVTITSLIRLTIKRGLILPWVTLGLALIQIFLGIAYFTFLKSYQDALVIFIIIAMTVLLFFILATLVYAIGSEYLLLKDLREKLA